MPDNYFGKPRLHKSVLEAQKCLFKSLRARRLFVLGRSRTMSKEDGTFTLVMSELTDGFYWIPAVFDAAALIEATGEEDLATILDALQGTTVVILDLFLGVCKRGPRLGVVFVVLDFTLQRSAAELPRCVPQDICLHPEVSVWLNHLEHEMPSVSEESILALYTQHKGNPKLYNMYQSLLPVIEFVLFTYYGELPPKEPTIKMEPDLEQEPEVVSTHESLPEPKAEVAATKPVDIMHLWEDDETLFNDFLIPHEQKTRAALAYGDEGDDSDDGEDNTMDVENDEPATTPSVTSSQPSTTESYQPPKRMRVRKHVQPPSNAPAVMATLSGNATQLRTQLAMMRKSLFEWVTPPYQL